LPIAALNGFTMQRHLTTLRRADLSHGVPAQDSERGKPWADSTAIVQHCARQILKELEPDELLLFKQSASIQSFRDYLSIHGERLAFDLDYMRELADATERVLEIGALPFMLTLPLMRRGYNVTALDKPTSEWDPAVPMRLGLNHVACDLDIQPLPFKTNSFDVVLINQVFAHLRVDLIGSMREIFRVLRPGGLLYLSSPNLRSFRALAQLIFRAMRALSWGRFTTIILRWNPMGLWAKSASTRRRKSQTFLPHCILELGESFTGEGSRWSSGTLFK
jgi:SAM-dependent methyltransferase